MNKKNNSFHVIKIEQDDIRTYIVDHLNEAVAILEAVGECLKFL